jgi:hypothetical protein
MKKTAKHKRDEARHFSNHIKSIRASPQTNHVRCQESFASVCGCVRGHRALKNGKSAEIGNKIRSKLSPDNALGSRRPLTFSGLASFLDRNKISTMTRLATCHGLPSSPQFPSLKCAVERSLRGLFPSCVSTRLLPQRHALAQRSVIVHQDLLHRTKGKAESISGMTQFSLSGQRPF